MNVKKLMCVLLALIFALSAMALAEGDGAILVGWSMGASSALRIAAGLPERIKGLALIAPTARMMKDDGWAGMTERRLKALEVGLKMTHAEGFFGVQEGKPNPYTMDSDENLARGLDYLRTTDLRAALAGMHIINDRIYGAFAVEGMTGHCLHSLAAAFTHPESGEPVEIRTPLPAWAR